MRQARKNLRTGPLRAIADWWLGEWDFLLIWAGIAIIALLAGDAAAQTIDAIRYAAVYH